MTRPRDDSAPRISEDFVPSDYQGFGTRAPRNEREAHATFRFSQSTPPSLPPIPPVVTFFQVKVAVFVTVFLVTFFWLLP